MGAAGASVGEGDAAVGNRGNPVIASHLRSTARSNELRRREVIDLGTSVA
jgi:hypothetical protein